MEKRKTIDVLGSSFSFESSSSLSPFFSPSFIQSYSFKKLRQIFLANEFNEENIQLIKFDGKRLDEEIKWVCRREGEDRKKFTKKNFVYLYLPFLSLYIHLYH
jgi:hypothetical protein